MVGFTEARQAAGPLLAPSCARTIYGQVHLKHAHFGSPLGTVSALHCAMDILVANRQRSVRFDLAWVRRAAVLAYARCLPHSGDGKFALREIPGVEVAMVSDRTIARVHEEFMDIPGATDVITFEHGEIVISAETARTYAGEHQHPVEHELALYIVHGLLHLNGFDDTTPAAKKAMFRVQDAVWLAVLDGLKDSPIVAGQTTSKKRGKKTGRTRADARSVKELGEQRINPLNPRDCRGEPWP
jgi:probable rRNA maturation factor